MATFYQATQMKELLSRKMLSRTGVLGIGVGYANPRKPKQGAAVIVYAPKNAQSVIQNMNALISSKNMSVPIRHIPASKAVANAAISQNPRARYRPVPGAVSIGSNVTGTAGLVVINFPNPSQLYLFSNSHVLNINNRAAFSPTIQPGPADGGTLANDRIGRLDRFVPIRPLGTGINFIDAATSIPSNNNLLNPVYLGVGVVPGHQSTYRVGDRFKKVGRTTAFVTGVVESVNTDINIFYSNYNFTAIFRNQTIVRSEGSYPVSLPGDSGSVWLNASTNWATAVNYGSINAQGGTRSISFPIQWFMQAFNTRVAIPAGRGGGVKKAGKLTSYAYARPLSQKELKTIRVVSVNKK